jgi:hypothetical protein
MNFELTLEDYTIILNALHYYKKVEKVGAFQNFDEKRINNLRDKMSKQLIPSEFSFEEYQNILDRKE